jgi:hypothetical protein
MEIRNRCRILNDFEMRGKGLKDKHAMKEPLPFLRSIRYYMNRKKAFRVTHLFVVIIAFFVQKTVTLQVFLRKSYTFFIGILEFLVERKKSQNDHNAGGSNSIAPGV